MRLQIRISAAVNRNDCDENLRTCKSTAINQSGLRWFAVVCDDLR